MSKREYFKLFACCIPVKGAKRSIICDLQRKEFKAIPNDLYKILATQQNLPVTAIKLAYNNLYDNEIDEYFDFLTSHEFGFWTDTPDLFPPLALTYESPSLITNAIIDSAVNSEHDYIEIFKQLEELGCKDIQLRFYTKRSIDFLENIIKILDKSTIKSVDLLCCYDEKIDNQKWIDLANQFGRIAIIALHSSPKDEIIFEGHGGIGRVVLLTQKIDNHTHCGLVLPFYFTLNITTFTEAQQYNSCLNKKIAIDAEGLIRNCPSMLTNFGNITDVSLYQALLTPNFKEYWQIAKDQIEICKDCEFRYICTDCRAFVENPKQNNSKPIKCTYNPYTAQWE
jgi:SPASM domain peptide maturase of grasp-with-spasm system